MHVPNKHEDWVRIPRTHIMPGTPVCISNHSASVAKCKAEREECLKVWGPASLAWAARNNRDPISRWKVRRLQKVTTNHNTESQWIHLQNTLVPKARGAWRKKFAEEETGKTVRARESGNLLWDCISYNVRSYTHKVSPTWLSKHELARMTLTDMPKWMRESPEGLSTTQWTMGKQGMPKVDK